MTQAGRVFRVFVSSTFSDLQAERDAIHARVFPRLRQLCQQHAARFQAVDLRWGVSDEAARDQRTIQICLAEIARCQQTTPRPNFIILLGDRYGWRPPPEMIPAEEFAAIAESLSDKSDQQLLRTWYRRDDNAVPATYYLQPRGNEYRDYPIWEARVERPLRTLLRDASARLKLSASARLKYAASATAQEVALGVTGAANAAAHAFGFFRQIESLPSDARARGFIDLNEAGQLDATARAQLEALKDDLRQRLPGQIYDYQARWTDSGITTDHLNALCEAVYTSLASSIVAELAQDPTGTPMQTELAAHRTFGEARARFFVGRADALQTIADYVRGTNPHPLGLWGASGVGKSTLMAQAATLACQSDPQAIVVARFIGATPASSDGYALLESLSRQITIAYGGDEATIPLDYLDLVRDFPMRLALATGGRPLVVFLDALDQLAATVDPLLTWLPATLPPHVRLVATTLPGEHLAVLQHLLPIENLVALAPLVPDEGRVLLDLWLQNAGRALQPAQADLVLESFARTGLPLHLRLLFEEARLWRSDTELLSLSPDIPGVIRNLFTRLSAEANHGALLVERSLGYLAAARHGLSEDEILGVLSADVDVLRDFQRRSPKSPLVDQLPAVIWSRLYADLEHYLGERSADNRVLLTYYHRQLGEAAAAAYSAPRLHRHLADYFERQTLYPLVDGGGFPNLRKLSELPYQLAYGGLSQRLVATLTDLGFLQAKVSAVGAQPLIDDYNLTTVTAAATPVESQANLRRIQSALQLSKHILASDPGELASQLTGRLLTLFEPEIRALLDSTRQKMTAPWLRPLTLSLTPPDGMLRHTLVSQGGVNAIAVSDDGERALSSSASGRVIAWDLKSGVVLHALSGHNLPVTALALAANGRSAVSGSGDGVLKVWDLEHGREAHTLATSAGEITALAMTRDGRRVVAGSKANFLTVWDLDHGTAVESLFPVDEAMLSEAQAFDRQRDEEFEAARDEAYAKAAGDVAALSVMGFAFPEAWRPVSRYQSLLTIRFVALSEDGLRAATVSGEGLIKVWDLQQGREEHAFQVGGTVRAVTIASEAWRAVTIADTGGPNKPVSLWDVKQGTKLSDLTEVYQLSAVALTADGRRAILRGNDGPLTVWDLERGREECVLPGHEAALAAATTDGRLVLSGASDGTLKLWSVSRDEDQSSRDVLPSTRARILGGYAGRISVVAISADERRVVFGLCGGRPDHVAIHLLDLVGGDERILVRKTGVPPEDAICALLITADGRRAVSSTASGASFALWDFERGVEVATHKIGTGRPRMVLTVDERRVVAGSYTGTWDPNLAVWNLERRSRERSLLHFSEILDEEKTRANEWGKKARLIREICSVIAVAVTPDGRRAITSGEWIGEGRVLRGSLRVWDLERGAVVDGLDEMTNWLRHVAVLAVTPDGRRVLSASSDTIHVWDLESGRRLHVLSGHTHPIINVLITPDGRCAISTAGKEDNPSSRVLKVWNLENGMEELHMDNHTAVAITVDGCYVYSILGEQTLTVWDLAGGNFITRFTAESRIKAWAAGPVGLTVAAGADLGRMHVVRLENLPLGPGVVTAWQLPVQPTSPPARPWWPFGKRPEVRTPAPPQQLASIAFGCPFCRTWSEAPAATLDTELACPHCARLLKLNPTVVEGDWRAVAQAWG